MGGEGQLLKRIPRIKFPKRHSKSSSSGSAEHATTNRAAAHGRVSASSDVPAPPINTAVGGKASLQPKRTPVTDREIEAILLGGCI
ncbi:uncharacterized protein LOC107414599 isoform X1 [Ziziphus jujuba]|uniref:Uncharacterized protein LOC107414599 isoform X1 n=1 Tax=Ziziphus jujuba TaxID=326968 RepID=A0A6P3ZIN7_ZIZJJ|nr:uncharacterized protein LOC107414599 isoform X1 [Ziziphus jujuba]